MTTCSSENKARFRTGSPNPLPKHLSRHRIFRGRIGSPPTQLAPQILLILQILHPLPLAPIAPARLARLPAPSPHPKWCTRKWCKWFLGHLGTKKNQLTKISKIDCAILVEYRTSFPSALYYYDDYDDSYYY